MKLRLHVDTAYSSLQFVFSEIIMTKSIWKLLLTLTITNHEENEDIYLDRGTP